MKHLGSLFALTFLVLVASPVHAAGLPGTKAEVKANIDTTAPATKVELDRDGKLDPADRPQSERSI